MSNPNLLISKKIVIKSASPRTIKIKVFGDFLFSNGDFLVIFIGR